MTKTEALVALAEELRKGVEIEAQLNEILQALTKAMVESALNTELDEHLGYSKNEISDSENNRNGYTSKTLKTIEH